MPTPARILVTGARGLLGRALCRLLASACPQARLCAAGASPPAGLQAPPGPVLDLTVTSSWAELPGPFDWVFHLAARIPSPGLPATGAYRANTDMALACLEHCDRWGTKALVHASSISVYPMGAAPVLTEDLTPRPNDLYGASKLAAERILALAGNHRTNVASLRFSSIYGPGPSQALANTVLYAMARIAREGGAPVVHGAGARTQDFLHVSDAALACLMAAQAGAGGEFNIGSGVPTSMLELGRAVLKIFGRPDRQVGFDPGAQEGVSVRVDTSKAREMFGFRARNSLEQGLASLA